MEDYWTIVSTGLIVMTFLGGCLGFGFGMSVAEEKSTWGKRDILQKFIWNFLVHSEEGKTLRPNEQVTEILASPGGRHMFVEMYEKTLQEYEKHQQKRLKSLQSLDALEHRRSISQEAKKQLESFGGVA